MLSTGLLLAERYLLSGRIAVGGMGEVWQANDTRLDRTVAVKVLKAELSDDAEFLHRFRTEARTTASLNHPNIAGVHDYGETKADEHSIAYLVMELVEGEPLAGILARERRIHYTQMLDILEQAGHALQAAHERGLVHRDVKPGNILVTASGKVKLTDFGIAKAADAAPVTRGGMVMGTAHYIAPEQALGHDAEPASDVYSLAVCGYECLTGYRPFLSENAVTVAMMHIRDLPPPLPADVPPGPRALIEATLVKDPRQRYGTGGEFANAVAAVRAGLPLPAPSGLAAYAPAPVHTMAMAPVGPVSRPGMLPVSPHHGPLTGVGPTSQQKRGHPGLWVAVTLVAVGLIVTAAILLPRMIGPSETPPGEATPSSIAPGSGGEQTVAPPPPADGDSTAEQPGYDDETTGQRPSSRPAQPPGEPTDRTTQPEEAQEAPSSRLQDNAPGVFERSPEDEGLQEMMSTLDGTERNGTDQ